MLAPDLRATDPARLYLVRHGRTALNAAGRLRGRLDPSLDEVGRAEASALAAVLAALRPVRVVSSPLRRAIETAEAIATAADLSVLIDGRLADRDYGPWAGSTEGQVIEEFGSLDGAPGVETAASVLKRAREALDDNAASLGDGPVVMVAHDAVNRLLLTALDPGLKHRTLPQPTACWNVLVRKADRWLVERVGEEVV